MGGCAGCSGGWLGLGTDLEIVVDPGILDPSNKMGLAEIFGAYSHYFVVNPTKC